METVKDKRRMPQIDYTRESVYRLEQIIYEIEEERIQKDDMIKRLEEINNCLKHYVKDKTEAEIDEEDKKW